MEKCVGVEWELEQICDVSLLTNQVIKVFHSYLSYCFYVQGKNNKSEFFYDTWNCLEVTIPSSQMSIFVLYPKTITWTFAYGTMLRSENSELSSFALYRGKDNSEFFQANQSL